MELGSGTAKGLKLSPMSTVSESDPFPSVVAHV